MSKYRKYPRRVFQVRTMSTLLPLAAACFLWTHTAVAAQEPCRDMPKAFYDQHLQAVSTFFAKSGRFPLEKVIISPEWDCGDTAYFLIEAKPEFNNVGYHWQIDLDKASGQMTIVDGI